MEPVHLESPSIAMASSASSSDASHVQCRGHCTLPSSDKGSDESVDGPVKSQIDPNLEANDKDDNTMQAATH